MKKLILLFFLIPFSVFAKFYQGSLTLNSGSILKGFIEIPNYDDSKIKFRSEKNALTDKYKIEDVKGFEIINEDNQTIKYTTLILVRPKIFKPSELKINKKKSWVCLIKEGKINLYSAYYFNQSGRDISYGYLFYIQKTDEKFARYIYEGIRSPVIGDRYAQLKNYLKLYFEKDCPNLLKSIENDDLDKNGLERIVEIYDQFCGE